MSELIRIMSSEQKTFAPIIGERTTELLSRFNKLDDDEKDSLKTETVRILSQCINPIDTIGSITNITVGYVQSGKTMSFTTLSALAVDNGFKVIIYLAGVKNNLLTQTTKRLTKDLLNNGANSKYYKLYENPTAIENKSAFKGTLEMKMYKPAILVSVLKHPTHIDEITKIFGDRQLKQVLGKNGVLIIDDEADQASLNTYARKNSKKSEDWDDFEFSAIYGSILRLKGVLENHSYVQYTATPQGPLLINLMDLLSPKHHTVLTPGKKYTGGKTFFIDNSDLIMEIPPNQVYHSKVNDLFECPQSLIDALQLFLMGVAIVVHIEERERFLSMMIHADSKNDASRKFSHWVNQIKEFWSKRLDLPDGDPTKTELVMSFKSHYEEIIRQVKLKHDFDKIMEYIPDVIKDTNIELVIQKGANKKTKEINWDNSTSHILIGAEMLNRGFTVENLSVTYMPRYSIGKSTADTIQQRCRFFGYKLNYLDVCRVFLPLDSAEEYREYVKHEEIMHNWLTEKNSLDEVAQILVLDPSMNATRKNILSKDVVQDKLNGWRQMNALQNIAENRNLVYKLLSDKEFKYFNDYGTDDRRHRYFELDIQSAINFLKDFKLPNIPDALRKTATILYLKYLANSLKISKVYIIEMAYQKEFRIRSLDFEKMKIGNIFSGPSDKDKLTYIGDSGIKFEDSICIQIHKLQFDNKKVKLPRVPNEFVNKTCCTLGIYYPPKFAISYIAPEKINK